MPLILYEQDLSACRSVKSFQLTQGIYISADTHLGVSSMF